MLKPGFCCFGVVDNCMLKCKMCHKWKPDKYTAGKEPAALDSWKNAIISLRLIVDKGFEIDIGGGEALMMKELWELVEFGAKKDFKMAIATNGYLLTEDMAKRIAGSGLHSLIISLDSLVPEKHDLFRGVSGVYKKVIDGIEHLAKHCPGLHVGICTIMMNDNLEEITAIADWVNSDNRLKSALFMAAMQPNNTELDNSWFENDYSFYWPQDIKKVLNNIDALIWRRNNGYKVGNTIEQLQAMKKYYQNPKQFIKKTKCNMDKAVHISSIGDIFLCYRWGVLGNIKQDNLAEVWHSKKAEEARNDIATCQDNCHFLLNCYFEDDYPFEIMGAKL